MKAHDVFPAVCYPDLFWKLAEKNLDAPWYLMCPHAVSYTHLDVYKRQSQLSSTCIP